MNLKDPARFNISNETREEKTICLKWQVRNAKGEIARTEQQDVLVPALCAVWLEKERLPQIDVLEKYVSFKVDDGEDLIADQTVIFSVSEIFPLSEPASDLRGRRGVDYRESGCLRKECGNSE